MSAATATKEPPPANDELEQEVERRVQERLEKIQKEAAKGWYIRTPSYGKKWATPSENLVIHRHNAKRKKGEKPREIKGGVIKMAFGQGYTADEDVANFCRDYYKYTIVPAAEVLSEPGPALEEETEGEEEENTDQD